MRTAYAYTVEKGLETVLCPALLGPRASPFLFFEVVTLEQWSETFLFHQGTQFKGNLTTLDTWVQRWAAEPSSLVC